MVTYSAKQILDLYEEFGTAPFSGGAAQIFTQQSQTPEQLSGRGVILTSVNSVYVKSKKQESKYKSFRESKPRSGKQQDIADSEGWTEVSKSLVKSGSGSRSKGDENIADKSTASAVIPVSSNKFGDLLFESSDSFFRDEAPQESPAQADGSILVKLLELRRSGPEGTTPTSSQPAAASDLSLNAPSFTPLAKERFTDPSKGGIASAHCETRLRWVYLDPNGLKQGPFSSSQMESWFSAGYFPANLPVAWFPADKPIEPNASFQPLDMVYSGRIPFQDEPISSASGSGRMEVVSPKATQKVPVPEIAPQKAWLWSPEEDARLLSGESKSGAAPSFSEIMALEARKGSKKKQ